MEKLWINPVRTDDYWCVTSCWLVVRNQSRFLSV